MVWLAPAFLTITVGSPPEIPDLGQFVGECGGDQLVAARARVDRVDKVLGSRSWQGSEQYREIHQNGIPCWAAACPERASGLLGPLKSDDKRLL